MALCHCSMAKWTWQTFSLAVISARTASVRSLGRTPDLRKV